MTVVPIVEDELLASSIWNLYLKKQVMRRSLLLARTKQLQFLNIPTMSNS